MNLEHKYFSWTQISTCLHPTKCWQLHCLRLSIRRQVVSIPPICQVCHRWFTFDVLIIHSGLCKVTKEQQPPNFCLFWQRFEPLNSGQADVCISQMNKTVQNRLKQYRNYTTSTYYLATLKQRKPKCLSDKLL